MRLFVDGNHPCARSILTMFRHPAVSIRTDSEAPDIHVRLNASRENRPEVRCGDPSIESTLLSQLWELGITKTVVFRDDGCSAKLLEVSIPTGDYAEAHEVAIERAVFRTVLLSRRRPETPRHPAKRKKFMRKWTRRVKAFFARFTLSAAMLATASTMAYAQEAAFIGPLTIHPLVRMLYQPGGLTPIPVRGVGAVVSQSIAVRCVNAAGNAFESCAGAGGAGGGDGAITDGVDPLILATVLDLASANPLTVAITDGSGNQITSFGGGVQYTEGDTDATISGTAMLMEGAANALVAAQGTAADGLLVNLGANNDVTVTGTVTANAGTNLNTSTLLTTTAHDAAFGTAGTADAQVRSIQGIASMTPVQVSQATAANLNATVTDGAGALNVIVDSATLGTVTVSGTVTANAGTGTLATDPTDEDTRVLGRTKIHDGTDTALVSGSGSLQVTCDNCGGATPFADDDAFTISTSAVAVTGYIADDTAPTSATEGSAAAPRMTLTRKPYAVIANQTGEVSATVTDLTNSNPIATQIVDANGDAITTFGGGDGIVKDGTGDTTQANVSSGRLHTDGSGVTQPISAAALPLPAGAATSALQLPDGHNVTIDNAAGAAAVNIQDGGNTITVDGTVAVSGSVAVTGPLTDAQLRATPVPISGTVAVSGGGGDGAILDGVSSAIKATVTDLTNSNPIAAAIVDGTGAQITSFGGGTQYTEGDTDASVSGTALMWEDASDTLRVASAAKPLPVSTSTAIPVVTGDITTINTGTNCDGTLPDTGCVDIPIGNANTLLIEITNTWSAVLAFQAKTPSGVYSAVFPFPNDPSFSPQGQAYTSGNGIWRFNVAGFTGFRVTAAAFTSGTATVTYQLSQGYFDDERGRPVSVSGTINAACADPCNTPPGTVETAGSTVKIALRDRPAVTFYFSTITSWHANNVAKFESSTDGIVWSPVNVALGDGRGNATNTTFVPVLGVTAIVMTPPANWFRVRMSAYTSGSAAIIMNLSYSEHYLNGMAWSSWEDMVHSQRSLSMGARRIGDGTECYGADCHVDLRATKQGVLYTDPCNGPNQWTPQYHENSSSALTDTTVHASCGTGLYNYICSITASIGGATAFSLLIEDSTTTTILGPYYLEAVSGRGLHVQFPGGRRQTTSATLVSVTTTGAVAHGIDITGFCGS